MLSSFFKDRRGSYAMITAVVTAPLMGALAIGIDYSEMTRQRQVTLNALDAAGIATARRAVEGATDTQLVTYAQEFFNANLGSLDPSKATLSVVLPSNNAGGGTLKLSVDMKYDPYFLGAFTTLMSGDGRELTFHAQTEIRLKNTLEVALVLDNSGSMDFNGSGTGKKRMVLLKDAAKQLVDTIAAQAAQMKQVNKPVQFGLVPFAASVNVGSQNADASWMDKEGRSPIHHENFDWSTMTGNKKVQLSGGLYVKNGTGWGTENGQKVTRFSLYDELQRVTATKKVKTGTEYGCIETNRWGQCTKNGWYDVFEDQPTAWDSYASWGGCVETRPHPYAYSDAAPVSGTPATLFVPTFAPDETDRRDGSNRRAMGNWWTDHADGGTDANRQKDMRKYFIAAPMGTAATGLDAGPNGMCSTTPITPLTDVSTAAGLKVVKDAIDAMRSLGATDVPEGVAWGWRVLSSGEPFTQGRPEQEKGNDKVMIVLTDGENTYYTPDSLGYNDLAGNKSVYSNKGYTGKGYNGGTTTRLYQGTTSVNTGTHTNANFTKAMNQHMDTVCEGAKAAGVVVMTVALDLSLKIDGEKAAIEALKRCASDSRFRRDPDDPSKPAKLFWNANGSNLADKFKEIADELSNLRIVG